MYKLYIFDLDGTLLDTLEDLHDAVNHTLRENGYPTHTLAKIRSYVGNGVRKLIERSLPAGTDTEETDRILNLYKAYYALHCQDRTKPYPGIPEALRDLRNRGAKIAVLSNKQHEAVIPICQHYFPGLIDIAAGDRPNVDRKPAPDGVLAILEEMKIAKEDAVYIGDSEVDVQTAKNAGLACIAVDWGFRDREVLFAHGAETVISQASGLIPDAALHGVSAEKN